MHTSDLLSRARALLGAQLSDGVVTVRVTEVEAYGGVDDPASHAFRGPSPRNAVMFGPPGRLYVYFTYGMHFCANVVVGDEGDAAAVLLRAGEVVAGADVARSRRGGVRDRDLARGPARLTQALGIGREHGGVVLDGSEGIWLRPPARRAVGVADGPRVGVSRAADRPWRFWIDGDSHVSAYRRSARTTDS